MKIFKVIFDLCFNLQYDTRHKFSNRNGGNISNWSNVIVIFHFSPVFLRAGPGGTDRLVEVCRRPDRWAGATRRPDDLIFTLTTVPL